MNNDKISIIVPIYNVEKYLKKCIDSILNQTYKNLEIILVDDGSLDGCPAICDEYLKKDNRIKVIHKKNGGLSDARNQGIKIATGKYIGFVDSDDWIEENMYELLHKKATEHNSQISICGIFIDYENGQSKIKNPKKMEFDLTPEEAIIITNSISYFNMTACDKLYKKELFDKIKYPVGKKYEDFYTTYKLFKECKKITYFSTPLYHYFQRENSISRNNSIDYSYIEATKEQLQHYQENNKNLVIYAQTSTCFAYLDLYNKVVLNNMKIEKKELQEIEKNVKLYSKGALKNSFLSIKKKIQIILFLINKKIYIKFRKIIKNK